MLGILVFNGSQAYRDIYFKYLIVSADNDMWLIGLNLKWNMIHQLQVGGKYHPLCSEVKKAIFAPF